MAEEVKTSTKRKPKRNYSFIVTLAIIALIGYFVISIISLQVEKAEMQQSVNQATQSLEQKQQENQELQDVLSGDDTSSYMERIARDILGYVLPGERVYYDISSGE